MSNLHTILIADDDKFIRKDLEHLLNRVGYQLLFAATAKETWEQISIGKPDVVLLDIKFPDLNDLSLLEKIRSKHPELEVLVLTSQTENVSQIVEAIKLGAYDYVPKPFNNEELLNRIKKALSLKTLSSSQQYLLNELETRAGLGRLIGNSSAIKNVVETVRKFAAADGCVLIRGESGTGKELVARALHYLSRRRASPFVTINAASIPEALVESVFFGHRRGAFTGAFEAAKGKFELAQDGTVFLDEIGDMPLQQQTSLLRVLEYRKFTPVGDSNERDCKARFIFATNRDLRESVREGTFREDLFYRLNVASILLPSLRTRVEDISLLVEFYLQELCTEMGRGTVKIEPDVIEVLQKHDWPGNVRELKNVLEGALMLIGPTQNQITLQDLPPELLACRGAVTLSEREQREKMDIAKALKDCNGNLTHAAKVLNWHRNTIRRKVRYYGIAGTTEGETQ